MVTYGTPATRAAKKATTKIPIVMMGIGDPIGTGLVASLGRPGGNITGNAILGPEVGSKRLQVFKSTIPSISRVAFLLNPANGSNVIYFESIQAPARTLGVMLSAVQVRSADEFDSVFVAMM